MKEKTIIEKAVDYYKSDKGFILHEENGWLENTEERDIIEGLMSFISKKMFGKPPEKEPRDEEVEYWERKSMGC
jgi:hypothetical protein